MLGWLRKKLRLEQMNSGLISAFTKIREDLAFQKRFLEDLYKNHHGFKETSSLNHRRIADWIKHFDKSIKKLSHDVGVLEKHIKTEFNTMSNASLKLFQDAYAKNIKDVNHVKKEIFAEVEVFLKDHAGKSQVNVANVSNVKNVMHEASFDTLSNPEKWLVGVLFNAENPLSYSQISGKTGKSINTVRVYMNQLKFKGFIDESSLPNGIKLFSLRHKAKVKKLYNL